MTKRKHSNAHEGETGGKPFSAEAQAKLISRVADLAEALCEAEGMELVFIEFQREPAGRVLRLYIDKPGGVKLDDCALISRHLGDILDVDPEDLGPYNLEVSSPGLERPLWRARDYDRFKGCGAKIKTSVPLNGQKNFKGVLLGIANEIITLKEEGTDKTFAIPFKEVARARLVEL